MSCLGVHFGLTDQDVKQVLARLGDDDALLELLEEGELADLWGTEWEQQSDVAWDAIDRCLTHDLPIGTDSPLRKCIRGGRQIYSRDDYFMALVSAQEAQQIAESIRDIDEKWMRERYFKIDPADYGFAVTEEDFQHTWEWFQSVQVFFQRVAATNRAVLFRASQ